LPTAELNILRAGVQSLQVLHSPPNQNGFNGSNTVPFVLAATVTDVEVSGIEYDNHLCMAEIRVCLDLDIGIEQKVFLLLNERTSANPRKNRLGVHRFNQHKKVFLNNGVSANLWRRKHQEKSDQSNFMEEILAT
jgi:hypothetical protein